MFGHARYLINGPSHSLISGNACISGAFKHVWRSHRGLRIAAILLSSQRRRSPNKTLETIDLGPRVQEPSPLEPFYDDIREAKNPARKRRSKKEAVVENVKDQALPQGLIITQDGPIEEEEEEESQDVGGGYPTVVQQARNNMRKFDPCVVLTRVGNFYELYFEHAEEYGPLLNLKVGYKKTTCGPVAMSGFPFFQLDRFLKVLVQDLGKHVAISEETANGPAQKVQSGGLLFDRQVKRVITPGTLIDENFLRPFEHNYLVALHVEDLSGVGAELRMTDDGYNQHTARIGLSWLDLSSGDFFTQSTEPSALESALARIAPREIVLDRILMGSLYLSQVLKQDGRMISYHDTDGQFMSDNDFTSLLEEVVSTVTHEQFTPEETLSANLLLHYVKTQLPGLKIRLQTPIRQQASEFMAIDKNSLRGLEVVHTLRDGLFKGSLLHAVRRTSTESGARLLAQRLTYPSMSLSVINDRLDFVELLRKDEALLQSLVGLLRQTSDTLRLVQKFSFGRGDADNLLSLARTIRLTETIGSLLENGEGGLSTSFASLLTRFHWEGPKQVADRIDTAIDEGGLLLQQRSAEQNAAEVVDLARTVLDAEDESTLAEMADLRKSLDSRRFNKNSEKDEGKNNEENIWTMRKGASPILEGLHKQLNQLIEDKVRMASALREQLNASSLSMKLTPGLGHICHVKGKDSKIDISTLENVRIVGSSKSTRSFYYPEWTRLGTRIEDVKLRIRTEEQSIFQSLRELVIHNMVALQKNAGVLDELDVACSSASLAIEHGLKRPILNLSHDHIIYGGRHLMVETGLAESGRKFVSNDCVLNENERTWLVTGPNMAGKSTFLRQTALISILAQTGSFVPAEYVEIGLVDKIFSRVGSADNLSQDQSTFMVEMLETAHILRNATHRSFVIMDEVGRGTTPEDGIAVGYAVLHHLQYVSTCRTLFATHFHALADMTKDFPSLACYCTNVVDEEGGSFRYDHKLGRGVNRKSHALKVAMLAGMPQKVIEMADAVLNSLNATPAKDTKIIQ